MRLPTHLLATVLITLPVSVFADLPGSETVHLVKDFNTEPTTAGSGPHHLAPLGDKVVFPASTPTLGVELWISDGTDAGTTLLKDIAPGIRGSFPRQLTSTGDLVFFIPNEPNTGSELWVTDGTPDGTKIIRDFIPGPQSGWANNLTAIGDKLFFSGQTLEQDTGLWTSDGTEEGTQLLLSGLTSIPTMYKGNFFFPRRETETGTELWKSGGTEAGTHLLKDLRPGSGSGFSGPMAVVGDLLFFGGEDGNTGEELWVTDGTAEGTTLVKDIHPGPGDSEPWDFVVVDGLLFFTANDGTNGHRLWISDGTEAGTRSLGDVAPSSLPRESDDLVSMGNRVYFAGYHPDSGTELWTSDGTEAGTQLVKNIDPEEGSEDSSIPRQLTTAGSLLFFTAFDEVNGRELWRSDGTEEGTFLLRVIDPDIRDSYSSHSYLTGAGTTLYFQVDDGTHGAELWRSDGTTEGTYLVKDIRAGTESGAWHVSSDEEVAYVEVGDDLWKSDGTEEGTVLLNGVSPATGELATLDNKFFFAQRDPTYGEELWSRDKFTDETTMVQDINPGGSSDPRRLTVAGNFLYFSADNNSWGEELWRTDGTPEGTIMLKDIYWLGGSSYPKNLTPVGEHLYFSATHLTDGTDLWKTDGNPQGTVMVKDLPIHSETNSSDHPADFVSAGDRLFFRLNQDNLWSSDGTELGTIPLREFSFEWGSLKAVRVGADIFFPASDGVHGTELWKSDGTPEGTVMVRDIASGPDSSQLGELCAVGNKLFFRHKLALWESDGTAEGTREVADHWHVSRTTIREFLAVGDVLYFQGNDGVHGEELWRHDARTGVTEMLADIAPGSGGSAPENLVHTNNRLFFLAQTEEFGTELYSYELPPNAPPAASNFTVSTTFSRILTVPSDDLLASASDPDGDSLTITAVESPTQGGTVALSGSNICYIPPAGWSGSNSFAVHVTDSRGATTVASVTITSSPLEPNGLTPPSVTVLPSGSVSLRLHVMPGQVYNVERSNNLQDWELFETFTAGPKCDLTLIDSNPPEGRGYYRIRKP